MKQQLRQPVGVENGESIFSAVILTPQAFDSPKPKKRLTELTKPFPRLRLTEIIPILS
ncbi:MAG: hypothetical protein VKL59_03770 [Nostocaceae cyanobacterium]|nr:hypothetical protein [Nostocaceae cyanobacterium]